MNPRTFGSITVVTTIFLGMVHALFATEVALIDFLWQDLLAVLFVVILARETGAIQSEDTKPISLIINNKVDDALHAKVGAHSSELNSQAMQSLSSVFEKLAERLASIESTFESKQLVFAQAAPAPAPMTQVSEPVKVVHSNDINARKTVKLINNDISTPAVPKAKQIMLKKILNENLNMQKKAS